MHRALLLLPLLILTGCAALKEEAVIVEPMVVEPVAEEPIYVEPEAPRCRPGDDGIGGTGCPVD